MNRWQRGGLLGLGVVCLVGGIVLLISAWRAISGEFVGGGIPTTGSGPGAAASVESASAGADPNAVHMQWIAALRHDDQAAALTLSAPQDQQAGVVDADLQMMQRYVPANAETGGVKTVDVQPVTVNGEERIGTSVWTFVNSQACFQATLTQGADMSWRVQKWERIPCR